jgi:hypothetical protein
MIRLMLARLLPYRSFPKFLALHGAGIVLLAYIASRFTSVEVQGQAQAISRLFEGAVAWHTVAGLTRWLYFVPAFFTVQLVASEMELRLVRAQVVAGLEHHHVVLVWGLQSTLLAAFGAVVAGFISAVLGGSGIGPALVTESGLFLYGLIFLSAAVCMTVYLRRPVPALVLLIAAPFVIAPMVGYVMGHYGLTQASEYLPFSTLHHLVPWPEDGLPINPTVSAGTLAACGYGVLANVLTWLRLKTTDL